MVKCAVRSCKNDTRKQTKLKSSITFHRFPKERNLMKKWIMALKQTNFEPNIWNKVCSVHFQNSHFYDTKKGLRKLLSTAVPSLFLGPSSCTSNNMPIDSEKPLVVCPLRPNLADTLKKRKLKKEISQLKDIATRRRLRCKVLYATQRRLKKKVENLSQILNELQEKINHSRASSPS